jgi:copper oxidase (laccase) domain-containing protein
MRIEHRPILLFDGTSPVSYVHAQTEIGIEQTRKTMLGFISDKGYTPEQTIMLTPYAGCLQDIAVIDAQGRIKSFLTNQDLKNPFQYYEIQPHDQTNALSTEGVFTFSDFLLLLKTGDCFSMLITADTQIGPCCGVVHAGRRPIFNNISLSWVEPLTELCNSPEKIEVTISPGLQAHHHYINPGETDPLTGTYEDYQGRFKNFCWIDDLGNLHLDIMAYLVTGLSKHGVQVHSTVVDSYDLHALGKGFSHRFATENGVPNNRNITAIHL